MLYWIIISDIYSYFFSQHFNRKLQKAKDHNISLYQIKADIEIKKAIESAEEAKLKQKQVEQDNLKLLIQLEQLKLTALDKIIPENKIESIRNILRKYRNKSLKILCEHTDIEAIKFLNKISALFRSSGWKVYDPETTIGIFEPFRGIRIISDKNNEMIVDQIAKIFEDMKFNVITETNPQIEIGKPMKIGDMIFIEVGAKELLILNE